MGASVPVSADTTAPSEDRCKDGKKCHHLLGEKQLLCLAHFYYNIQNTDQLAGP